MSHLPTKRLPRLPDRIDSPSDILEFFGYLNRVDKTSFHPDDSFWNDAEERVQYVDAQGHPSYTPEEAQLRDELMAQAFDVADAEGLDIYELGLWVTTDDLSDAPDWVRETVLSWGRPTSTEPSMNGRGRRSAKSTRQLYDVRWEGPDGEDGYYALLGPREAQQIRRLLEEAGRVEDVRVEPIPANALDFNALRDEIRQRYY